MTTLIEKARNGEPINGIIDIHAHIGPGNGYYAPPVPEEGILKDMDKIGIERTCISYYIISSGEIVKPGLTWANDLIIEYLQKYPDRFLGYCHVSPAYEDQMMNEIERCFKYEGMAGLKLYVCSGVPYDDSVYDPVYEWAQEKDVPILFHAWGKDTFEPFHSIASRYPRLPLILAHTGVNDDTDSPVELAEKYPNIYLDLTLSIPYFGLVERLVDGVGAQRVLWGSDTLLFTQTQQIGKVLFAHISEEEKWMIIRDNARELFKLD